MSDGDRLGAFIGAVGFGLIFFVLGAALLRRFEGNTLPKYIRAVYRFLSWVALICGTTLLFVAMVRLTVGIVRILI